MKQTANRIYDVLLNWGDVRQRCVGKMSVISLNNEARNAQLYDSFQTDDPKRICFAKKPTANFIIIWKV